MGDQPEHIHVRHDYLEERMTANRKMQQALLFHNGGTHDYQQLAVYNSEEQLGVPPTDGVGNLPQSMETFFNGGGQMPHYRMLLTNNNFGSLGGNLPELVCGDLSGQNPFFVQALLASGSTNPEGDPAAYNAA